MSGLCHHYRVRGLPQVAATGVRPKSPHGSIQVLLQSSMGIAESKVQGLGV